MTDDSDGSPWLPGTFTKQLQEAGEQVAQSQQEMMRQLVGAGVANPLEGASAFGPMNAGTATFKARVQSGGRISIPDAEREVLDIDDGDIVQTFVIPLTPSSDSNE